MLLPDRSISLEFFLYVVTTKKQNIRGTGFTRPLQKTLVPLLLTTRQYLLIDIIFEYIGIDLHNSYAHCQL